MNRKLILPLIIGVSLVIAFSILIIPQESPVIVSNLDSSYDANFELQKILNSNDIMMSNPLRISGDAIQEHCNFFDNVEIQKQIQYCTSTELRDDSGQFLGNIHLVGTPDYAQTAIAIIQSDPFISQESDIATISDAMITTFVCDCWEEKTPGGFESISDWIDAAKTHHLEAKRITSKSEIGGLAQKQVLLEITTNTEGYLWKLLVGKYE